MPTMGADVRLHFRKHIVIALKVWPIYTYNICNVYIGSRRAIYNNIAPRPRFFLSEAENHDARGIFQPRTKKYRGRGGYIVVFSSTRPNIYNIYTTFSVLAKKRNTFQVLITMEHAATTKIKDAITMRQFSLFCFIVNKQSSVNPFFHDSYIISKFLIQPHYL